MCGKKLVYFIDNQELLMLQNYAMTSLLYTQWKHEDDTVK